MDRLHSMKVFAKVVEQGSFVRAAEILSLSNAVVTRYIVDLENHLGTRLLNRSTRRLSLTESGQVFLERVRNILAEIEEAEAIVAMSTKQPTGTLSIYSHVGFGEGQLGGLLPEYSRAFPEVVVDITLSDRVRDLVEEGIDVGFFSSFQKFDANMVVRKLGVAEVVLCASPDYIAQYGAPQTPDELSKHVCVNFSHEHLRHFWHVRTEEGNRDIPITSVMVSNNALLLRDFALAGMGIAMRPSFSLGNDLRCGKLQRVLADYQMGQVEIFMVYPSRRLLSAKVRTFVDFMTSRFPHPETDPWL